jgi:hypothetical protein
VKVRGHLVENPAYRAFWREADAQFEGQNGPGPQGLLQYLSWEAHEYDRKRSSYQRMLAPLAPPVRILTPEQVGVYSGGMRVQSVVEQDGLLNATNAWANLYELLKELPLTGTAVKIDEGLYLIRMGKEEEGELALLMAVPSFAEDVALVGGALTKATDKAISVLRAAEKAQATIGTTSRRSFGSWFRYWNDAGGETLYHRAPNPTFFRMYSQIVVHNFETPGTAAYLDTAAHEGLHALVGRRIPVITALGDAKVLKIPVGAPIKYVEEVAAYATGHLAAGRLHGLPFVPLEAFASLTRREGLVVIASGAGGGYAIYKFNQKQSLQFKRGMSLYVATPPTAFGLLRAACV